MIINRLWAENKIIKSWEFYIIFHKFENKKYAILLIIAYFKGFGKYYRDFCVKLSQSISLTHKSGFSKFFSILLSIIIHFLAIL